MAKMTLLEMAQDILNDTDSDEVNSIDDTTESIQVAQIIKTAYFKLIASRDEWPFLRTRTALTGLGDTDNPTKMQIPAGVNKILWVKYNGEDVAYLDPKDFQDLIDNRETQAGVVDANGYVINADPQYWTTFDDEYVHFDGYDSDAESTLQTSNSTIYVVQVPSWEHENDFTPTLPEKMFPTLLADAKGTAFLVLKQQANPKEEAFAKRTRSQFQHAATRSKNGEPQDTGPNYGRK